MYRAALLFALSAISLVNAAPAQASSLDKRQTDQRLLITFWEAGCNTDGGQSTFIYSDDGPSMSGDCEATANFGWKNYEVENLGTQSWSIEFFSGLGCNNPVLVSIQGI